MKTTWTRIWKRKWLVAVGTMVIFLSIGAAAWAATGDGTSTVDPGPAGPAAAEGAALAPDGPDQPAAAGKLGPKAKEALKQKHEAMKEKHAQRMKRVEGLMSLVREKMTDADQATYDRLVETAKEQREALQEAKKDLGETLKELRALTHKYIDDIDAAAPAGTATSVQ